jgi:hypothetical protein
LSKHEIEALIQRATQHPLDFFEHAKRIEPLDAATIKTEDAIQSVLLVFGGQVRSFAGMRWRGASCDSTVPTSAPQKEKQAGLFI